MAGRRKPFKESLLNPQALMLFVGLLLSQTRGLQQLQWNMESISVPIFALSYLFTTTIFLLLLMLGYVYCPESSLVSWSFLDTYEYLIIPTSQFVVLLTLNPSTPLPIYVIAFTLFSLQSALIWGKIFYCGTIQNSLATVSKEFRLLRILRLVLGAIFSAVFADRAPFLVIAGLLQLTSPIVFLVKFTFLSASRELFLFITVIAGIVSSFEAVISTINQTRYFFLGEIVAISFYFLQRTVTVPFVRLLELKYQSHLRRTVYKTNADDQLLIRFHYIKECLLASKRTLEMSEEAVNYGYKHAVLTLKSERNGQSVNGADEFKSVRPSYDESEPLISREVTVSSMVDRTHRDTLNDLLQKMQRFYHNSPSFQFMEYLVICALEKGEGQRISQALLHYHAFFDDLESNQSIFKLAKFKHLHIRIKKRIAVPQQHHRQEVCLNFETHLNSLQQKVTQTLKHETLIAQLLSEGKRKGGVTEAHLLQRNQLKKESQAIVEKCISSGVYLDSGRFKLTLILFEMSVVKQPQKLTQKLSRLYSDSRKLEATLSSHEPESVMVVTGLGPAPGAIVSSNEVYKRQFGGEASELQSKNLSVLIPGDEMKLIHTRMMVSYAEGTHLNENKHKDYDCYLTSTRLVSGHQLEVFRLCHVTTRMYYELYDNLRYVCSIKEGSSNAQKTIINNETFEQLIKDNVKIQVVQESVVSQLENQMEVRQINIVYKESYHQRSSVQEVDRSAAQSDSGRSYLDKKLKLIEDKRDRQSSNHFSVKNFIEIILLLALAGAILWALLWSQWQVNIFESTLQKIKTPVRQTIMARQRMRLYRQIITYFEHTPFFAQDECSSSGISDLPQYLFTSLNKVVSQDFDGYNKMVIKDLGDQQERLIKGAFDDAFRIPFLRNPRRTGPYRKTVNVLRGFMLDWSVDFEIANGYFRDTYPQRMMSAVINADDSPYYHLSQNIQEFNNDFQIQSRIIKVGVCVGIFFVSLLVAILRMNDYSQVLHYLRMLHTLRQSMILRKIDELKNALILIDESQSHHVTDSNFNIGVGLKVERGSEEDTRNALFANERMGNVHGNGWQGDEQRPYHGVLGFMQFNKKYIGLTFLVISGLICLFVFAVEVQKDYVGRLLACDKVAEDFTVIQQKYVNVVAYNWIHRLSLYNSSLSFPSSSALINEALDSLKSSPYQQHVIESYDKATADQILYGNVCQFFDEGTINCSTYRNGIFAKFGISQLIPFTIKEELSSKNSDEIYLLRMNACDRTILLLEGVIPMTFAIPRFGLQRMIENLQQTLLLYMVGLGLLLLVFACVTVFGICIRIRRQAIIRDQVLSIETARNLYPLPDFQTELNLIYCS